MSQVTDRTVGAKPTGFDMRTKLNNIIGALETCNSGTSEPLNTVQFMYWFDTSNATYYYLKQRNHDNTAWNTILRYTVATKIVELVSNGVVVNDSNLVHKTGNETIAGVKTFTGTVTAPTFSGALNGNATTATNAGNADEVNGFSVHSEGLSLFKGFNTDGHLVHYSGLDLNTMESVNRRGTFSNSLNAPNTGFFFLDHFAYQDANYALQIITELGISSPNVFVRAKSSGTWASWLKIAIDRGGILTDVNASRSLGVTYTNDSGTTRFVLVGYGYSVTQSTFYVNGVARGIVGSQTSGNIGNGIFTFPVPAGATYMLSTGISKNYWNEYIL